MYTDTRPKGEITIPTHEYQEIIERWFEDLFTRGDLSAVDELVSADFVAYCTGGDGRTIETRGPRCFPGVVSLVPFLLHRP
jgi:hypothetical protein